MKDRSLYLSDLPIKERRKDSLVDQLTDLKDVATRLGMYDAADEVQRRLNTLAAEAKMPHTEKMAAINEREERIEERFKAWWKERSELFRKQFTSSSIAREVWEHAVNACHDIPMIR